MEHSDFKNKIGILGGTFNPIHLGHLILAQNAFESLKLDKVLIMPSGVSYLKDPGEIVSKEHRINMVSLAIKDNEAFELSQIETNREGNSYTYETLKELKETEPLNEYYYIIGADTLFSMDKWVHPELIFDKCTIVCAKRDGYKDAMLNDQVKLLKDKYSASIIIMNYDEVDISSSSIRKMLKSGKSCRYYLPEKVMDYIKDNGLYIG